MNKNKQSCLIISVALLGLFQIAIVHAAQDTVSTIAEFKPAVLLQSAWARHPWEVYELTEDTEPDSGVVELVFMVNKNGQPSHIEVARSSEDFFTSQAIDALSKYRYQAATIESKPVESRQTAKITFDHSKLGRPSLGRSSIKNHFNFVRQMQASETYLVLSQRLRDELNSPSPNKRKAKHTLGKIQRLRDKTYFTLVQTELAKYYYAQAFQGKEDQLEPLLNIMMYKDIEWNGEKIVDTQTKETVQIALLALLLELGYNAEALLRYTEYSAENSGLEQSFSEYMDKINVLRASDAVVERLVTLTDRGIGFLPLLKRAFVLEPVDGSIASFQLRCQTQYAEFAYKADAQYELPASWGECEIQLNGTAGSRISVLQQ